jgi:two-component system chemotaxis sensor kinase CheA
LIFLPGLSTAASVSDISGRGVGMDVVKKNIEELGGAIDVSSDLGKGCRFKIRLPLTLAILDGQMVQIEDQIYIIPLQSIVESLQMRKQDIYKVGGESEVYQYRGNYIPVIQLKKELGLVVAGSAEEQEVIKNGNTNELLVIIDVNGENVGFCVDDIIGQQQVVIKSLEKNYRHVHGLAGATVLGDGSVAMIIDVYDISKNYLGQVNTNKMIRAGAAEKPLPLH